jgi:hypothetical protein
MRWKPKPLRVKIRRALWTIKFEKPPGNQDLHGRCFHNQRTIYVRPDECIVGTSIHEIGHAVMPWASEEEINELESVISTILQRLT